MKRLVAVLLCAALSGLAQTPIETAELLALTGNLRNALRADDSARAATLSAALKEALRIARNRALAARTDEEIDNILGWLPTDTETVMAAREPFTLDFNVASARPAVTGPLRLAQGYTLLPLMTGAPDELKGALEGRTLRYAVFAARRFQNRETAPGRAMPLGLIAMQGCGVYALPQPIEPSYFAKAPFSRAPEEMLFGFEAWMVKNQRDTVYLARPRPELLVACSDRGFLSDLLSRVGIPQSVRAFPPNSPLLKAVDRATPLWAVRRFLPERAAADPTHPASGGMLGVPDPEATGLAVDFGARDSAGKRTAIRAQWFSGSRANPWQALAAMPAVRGNVVMQQNSDGAWQVSVAQDRQALLVAFTLMGVLGFVALV